MATIALDSVENGGHSKKRSSMGLPVHALGLGKPKRADKVGAMSRMLECCMLVWPFGIPGPIMRNGTCVSYEYGLPWLVPVLPYSK